MTKKRSIILFLLVWIPLATSPAPGLREYLIKGALLENFARFIKWPPDSGMKNPGKSFIIGVIGESPINTVLEKAYEGNRKIKRKKVLLKYFETPREIKNCHILFIPVSAEKKLSEILSIIGKKPVLTVGETRGLVKKGIHISLYVSEKGQKVVYEINPVAMSKVKLSAGSAIFKMAVEIAAPVEKDK